MLLELIMLKSPLAIKNTLRKWYIKNNQPAVPGTTMYFKMNVVLYLVDAMTLIK